HLRSIATAARLVAAGKRAGRTPVRGSLRGIRREWQRAAGHGLSLLAWEGQSETRTFAGLAPRDEFATVQAGVLLTDGKAEARAAGVAVSGRVGAPGPGQHQLLLPRGQTDTGVARRGGEPDVAPGPEPTH